MDYNEHGKIFLYKFLLTEYRNGSILNFTIKGLQRLEKPHMRKVRQKCVSKVIKEMLTPRKNCETFHIFRDTSKISQDCKSCLGIFIYFLN